MAHHLQNLKAIALVTLGFALFAFSDAILKLLAQNYTTFQTLFWTCCFTCLSLVAYSFVRYDRRVFKTTLYRWHIVRGLLMMMVNFCNIYAFLHIQLTDFYAVVFTTPLTISVLSWLILKDRLTVHQLVAVTLGLGAVIYMCRPGAGLFNVGALVAFIGTLFFIFATLLLRSKLKHENGILLSLNGPSILVIAIAPLIVISGFPVPDTALDWGLFVVGGTAVGFGGITFVLGYQYASSTAVVAPFQYTQIIWGALLGYFLFQEIPTIDVIIGSTILIILGLYLIYSEAKTRHEISGV